jgi:hypothetical protein
LLEHHHLVVLAALVWQAVLVVAALLTLVEVEVLAILLAALVVQVAVGQGHQLEWELLD